MGCGHVRMHAHVILHTRAHICTHTYTHTSGTGRSTYCHLSLPGSTSDSGSVCNMLPAMSVSAVCGAKETTYIFTYI